METIYIVKGLSVSEQNDESFSIISENAVHKTMENAQKELKLAYQEIIDDLDNNEIEIEEELVEENQFMIYTEYGEKYSFEIVERKIFE